MKKSLMESSGRNRYVAYLRNCADGLQPHWAGFAVSVMIIIYWAVRAAVLLKSLIHPDINGYGYTEMLINFEGGFVRRGLLGEILYYVCSLVGISPIILIHTMCLLALGFVIFYFLRRFYKLELNWWILASPLLLGSLYFCIRKDWMLFALLMLIYWLIRDVNASRGRIVCAILLSVLGLFLHEAFLFWGIPVVIISLLSRKSFRGYGIAGAVIAIAVFMLMSFFKGSEQQAYAIVESWQGMPGCELLRYQHENSIGALGWSLGETVSRHLYYNFCFRFPAWIVVPVRILWLLMAYYLLSNFMFTFRKDNVDSPHSEKTAFSAMLLFSLLCLLPMFLFLSCDWARLYQYMTVSTFGAYVTFSRDTFLNIFNERYLTVVARINRWLDKAVRPTAWLMTILLLLLSVSLYYFLPAHGFTRSIIGTLIVSMCRIL